jgi:TonB-linked SusC/RagA family outer membrane protein
MNEYLLNMPDRRHGTLRKLLLSLAMMILLTSASVTANAEQTLLEKTFSLSVRRVTLESLILKVQEASMVQFTFSSSVLKNRDLVDFVANDKSVRDFLEEMLVPNGVGYRELKNRVVLYPTETSVKKTEEKPAPVISEDRKLIGQVLNEQGQPEEGVSVKVKGGSTGTSTDKEGRYSLDIAEGKTTIVFSAVGYTTIEIEVTNQQIVDVVLRAANKVLDDVVVVGYGTQRKGDVTGSVVRVTTDKTADLPNYNVLQSIQGRAPGLNITTPDRPGENPRISIRGINSISASTSPLIVLDGVIFNGSLNEINANDIASVDILKDASAAAVYGSRAANGVLLITSKVGKSGKPQFSFNTYAGTQSPDRLVKVLDGPGYVQKVLDFRTATGLSADPNQVDSYLTPTEANNRKNGNETDWMKQVIQPSTMNNYHLDVSGKTDLTNYYISGTYFQQHGIVVNDNFRRMTVNMNLTNKIRDWYSISVKSMFSSQDFSGREANLQDAYRQSPYGSFSDPNGPGGYALLPVGDPLGTHPLANTLIQNKDRRTSFWGLLSSNLDFPFLPGLKWTSNLSSNLRENRLYEYQDKASSPAGMTAGGIASKMSTQFIDWTFDNYLNYKQKFGRHSVDATVLYSREYNQIDLSSQLGRNFFTEANGYNNMAIAGVKQVASNFENQNAVAFMGRLNYGFDNRYAITLTARRDGYSGFSEGNKFAIFPSVAAAWTASNERFMAGVKWLNHLKLRLSYGENGNQAVGRYQSLARMTSGNYVFGSQSVTSIFVNSMANNALTWETTTSRNFGADFTIANWRLNGSIDVYASVTTDILLQKALPQTSGFSDIFTNVGQVSNRGAEFSLTSVNVKENQKGFSWESGFVFSLNRNRIDKLTGADANKDGVEDDDIRNSWFIGKPLGSFFGYQTNGVYQLNEPGMMAGFRAGDYRILDVDKDGKISPTDRIMLGSTLPNFTFSISNTLKYKDFSLYMLVQSIQGGNGYYLGNNFATRSPNAPFTSFTERFNVQDVPYWTPNRPSEEYPRINYNPSFPHPYLEDRSFVRLQDVSLSYNVARQTIERLRVKGLRIYLSAKNLITLTKWTGYDPENATTISDFPLMRSFTAGIDFKF